MTWVAIVAGSLVVGGVGGSLVSKSVRSQQTEQEAQMRVELQESVLRQMGSLEIGDTLQDHLFEDVHLNPVQLSQIISGTTIISVFDPGCDACLEEIATYQRCLPEAVLTKRVVFISAGNPRYIAELVESTGLQSHVLYDHHSAWLGSYRILTFPLNIVVDSSLVVSKIVIGSTVEDELKTLGNEFLQED